ncbi:MAG: hypothetical protein ACOYLL_09980 [Beijerinckiaceae bacterium]
MSASAQPMSRRWFSLLGVVLAYVLVVQALVAPLHALAGVTLSGDRSLAVICLSHEHVAAPDDRPAQPAGMTCCEQGCLSAVSWLAVPLRGGGEVLPVVREIGTQNFDAGLADGFLPPERSGGHRHPPRAPPRSIAVI